MNKDGIIAQDIEVQRNEPIRIPIEIWKDDKMLFPEFDESIGGRNYVQNSKYREKPIGTGDITLVPAGIYLDPNDTYTISFDYEYIDELDNPSTMLLFRGGSIGQIPIIDFPKGKIIYTFKHSNIGNTSNLYIYGGRDYGTSVNRHVIYQNIKLEKGNNPNPVWTPAPEELLTIATINAVHCYYEIDGSDIILSNFTENKGYVDIEVSYGDDWIRTKRINFTRKNRIHDIQIKDKKPYRAYFNRVPIWWKYHERTQAIFDYANERYYQLPTNKLAYDDYIRGVVKEGLFDKLDLHYIFSGDGDINFKLLNIINPGTYNGTAFGGLEWSNEGVKGNGVNGYIDTNFIPSLLVEGQKYQLNDASRGIVVTNIGTTTGNNATLDSSRNPNHSNYMRLNSSGVNSINSGNEALSATDMSGIGFKSINRFSVENIILTNRENIFNRSATVSILSPLTQVILRGVFSTNYGDQTIAAYMMGSALTFEQTQIFRQIYNKYLTAIGLDPIA